MCIWAKKNVLTVYNIAAALSNCLGNVSIIERKITDFPGNCFDVRFEWT